MTEQIVDQDVVIDCYRALDGSEADTCCKRMLVMVQRMQRDQTRDLHEQHLVVLSTQLLASTKTFGFYVAELHSYIENDDYGSALSVCRIMIDHENLLKNILDIQNLSNAHYLNS